MRHFETSLPGIALLIFAAYLFSLKVETTNYLAGVAALAGIALLRTPDANKTVQKDELHELGIVGRKLDREVKANDEEKK